MFQIPEEKLPDFLKDEQRINVLFAPLRKRNVNPKDWDSKISSWKHIIKLYCECNDIYSFTLTSLCNIFVKNGRPPNCLNEVIADMLKNGEIQITEVFLKRNSNSWSAWATDLLIKRPLSWSYNKIKDSVFSPTNDDKAFVHLDVIKLKCDMLLSTIPHKFQNKLICLKDLLQILNKDSSHINDIKLLLHFLLNQHKIDVRKLQDSQEKEEQKTFLIKFGDGAKVSPISEIDIGIFTLENNEKLISKSIETLEDSILNCIQEAKVHLSKNHRLLAKSCLRKKHELEKRVEKKSSALQNIQILLQQIHETHIDAHVWEAYKHALSAFDTSYKESGLTEDAVEDTIIKLGDMLDKHEDIQSALARPATDTFDEDLEEELAELINNTSNQPPDDSGIADELEKLNLNLPNIPDKNPDISLQKISTPN